MGSARLRNCCLGVVFLLLISGGVAHAQTPLPGADQVMSQAEASAKAEHKKILIVFSASWCGPCHMFQKFLDDPQVRPVIEKNFVVAHLDVGEHAGDKAHSNSPGGPALMLKLGGRNVGYPYIVITDDKGEWIIDSVEPVKDGPGQNTGYPSAPNEIDWFMRMLRKSVPDMAPADVKTIRQWLDQHGG